MQRNPKKREFSNSKRVSVRMSCNVCVCELADLGNIHQEKSVEIS